ncbi:MAG: glycerophosphodiester phosphodiesterase family protein [Akkermansiaceae bacterium]|nr:glycerophosphodiester phosphodiesterase family protein [Akkermansiaceae bacterium]
MLRFLLTALACLTIAWADPVLVAHRGSSSDAPENTLPAFDLAWEQGANAIEGDFHLTNDGHIVCIHDGNTKRTGNRKLTVAKSSLAELQTVDVGSWKSPRWDGTRIPTLSEVLSGIPRDRFLFLEVKCEPEIVPALLTTLNSCSLTKDQVTVISFNSSVIQAYKKTAPHRPASGLCKFKKKADRPGALRKELNR